MASRKARLLPVLERCAALEGVDRVAFCKERERALRDDADAIANVRRILDADDDVGDDELLACASLVQAFDRANAPDERMARMCRALFGEDLQDETAASSPPLPIPASTRTSILAIGLLSAAAIAAVVTLSQRSDATPDQPPPHAEPPSPVAASIVPTVTAERREPVVDAHVIEQAKSDELVEKPKRRAKRKSKAPPKVEPPDEPAPADAATALSKTEPEKPVRFADVTVFGSSMGYGHMKFGKKVVEYQRVGSDHRIETGDYKLMVKAQGSAEWRYYGDISIVTPGRYKLIMTADGPRLEAG